MNKLTELFDHYPDFLSHTLAHIHAHLPPIMLVLEGGTTIERMQAGILCIEPYVSVPGVSEQAPLILSAGIHGDETAPVEILNNLVERILKGELRPCRPILIILGNPAAMVQGTRFVDFNMNRLFCGVHADAPYHDSVDGRRAYKIETAVNLFVARHAALGTGLHYDLHTAIRASRFQTFALYPWVKDRQISTTSKQTLQQAGIEAIVLQNKTSTTFSSYTSTQHGMESFTLELGRIAPFGQNKLSEFDGIIRNIQHLVTGDNDKNKHNQLPSSTYEVCHEIINSGSEFQLNVPDNEANFTEYPKGTVIWQDGDDQYSVQADSEYIIFPNPNVPIGQRAGLMLRKVPA